MEIGRSGYLEEVLHPAFGSVLEHSILIYEEGQKKEIYEEEGKEEEKKWEKLDEMIEEMCDGGNPFIWGV